MTKFEKKQIHDVFTDVTAVDAKATASLKHSHNEIRDNSDPDTRLTSDWPMGHKLHVPAARAMAPLRSSLRMTLSPTLIGTSCKGIALG